LCYDFSSLNDHSGSHSAFSFDISDLGIDCFPTASLDNLLADVLVKVRLTKSPHETGITNCLNVLDAKPWQLVGTLDLPDNVINGFPASFVVGFRFSVR